MKQVTTTLIALLCVVQAFCQFTGLGGNGSPDIANIQKLKNSITYYNTTIEWQQLETSENVWNWSLLDQYGANCKANNLRMEFMIYTGHVAPPYLYQKGVPKVFTDAEQDKYPFYPYYFNAYYQTRFKNMLVQVKNHIQNSAYKDIIFQWWVAEGVTGDDFAWKGDPLNPAYNISKSEWGDYKRSIWTYIDSLLATITPLPTTGAPVRIGVNSGNDGENFAWAAQHLHEGAFKLGNFGHNIFFPGDWFAANRLNALDTTASKTKNLSRSEFQQIYKTAFWKIQPKGMTWWATINAVTGGLKQFNITAANLTENVSDLGTYDEFNEFSGVRRVQDATEAMIVLGNPINLTDTVLYDTATYHSLVAAADLTAYNIKYNNQVTTNTVDSIDKIQSNATGLMVDYINPVRISAIMALYPTATYSGIVKGNDNDTWNNDANIYGRTNYGKFVTMVNPAQSKLLFKTGMSVDSKFGRFARTFDNAHHDMFFDIDDNFSVGNGLIIEVTYLDTATGKWRLNYNDGRLTHSARVTSTATNKWKTQIFTIPHFVANGLGSGMDISLEYMNGIETPFQMIKFKRIVSLN